MRNNPPNFPLESVLRHGLIPSPVECQVERTELVEKVRKELYKLKDSEGSVLIHGLGGFGKTTLAAESVRCASLLQDVFPGGVFWLNVNKMSSEGEVDKSKLLEKLQNLIRRVDKNKDQPPNIEAATEHLQVVMEEQHPNSLLILDDIWESEVAKAFNVRCCVLATSRNAEIATALSTTTYTVSVTGGLSDEEAKQLLSGMSKIPLDSLPKEADDVIQYCMGSPLALRIIAAKLSKPNTPRVMWKKIVKELNSRSKGTSLATRVNNAIGLSIEDLSEELKKRFQSLVVFANSAVIPAHVLGTFWSVDEFCGSDIMDGELLFVCLVISAHCKNELVEIKISLSPEFHMYTVVR